MQDKCHFCGCSAKVAQKNANSLMNCSSEGCRKCFCSKCIAKHTSKQKAKEQLQKWICLVCKKQCKCRTCQLKRNIKKIQKIPVQQENAQKDEEKQIKDEKQKEESKERDEKNKVEEFRSDNNFKPFMQRIWNRKKHLYGLMKKKKIEIKEEVKLKVDIQELVLNTQVQYKDDEELQVIIEDTQS